MCVDICTCTCIYVLTYMYVYRYIYIYIHICVDIYMCVCRHIYYLHICVDICMYMYIRIRFHIDPACNTICINVCVNMYVYRYIHTSFSFCVNIHVDIFSKLNVLNSTFDIRSKITPLNQPKLTHLYSYARMLAASSQEKHLHIIYAYCNMHIQLDI